MNPGLVVKLRPSGPWRIGPDSGARNRVDVIYHSDSLYSAVTAAMSRLGWLEEWLDATARTGSSAVSFSSCFPFMDSTNFVVPPRTVWPPTSPAAKAARVRWKSARFVPLKIVQSILAGKRLDENQWTVDGPSDCLVPNGRPGPFRTAVRWSAGVDRLTGVSERHSTACLEFRPGSGLWTVVSFLDDAAQERWGDPVKAAFRLLADTGFGGERSRGWGRSEAPEFFQGMLPDLILPLPKPTSTAAKPEEVAEVVVGTAASITEAENAGEVAPLAAKPEEVAEVVVAAAPSAPVTEAENAGEVAPHAAEPEEVAEVVTAAAPPAVPVTETESAAEVAPLAAAAPEEVAEAMVAVPATEAENAGEVAPHAAEPEEGAEAMVAAPSALLPLTVESEVDNSSVPGSAASEPAPILEEITEGSPPDTVAHDEPQAAVESAPETPAAAPAIEPVETVAESETAQPVQTASTSHPHWLLSVFTPAATDTVDWQRGNYTVLARGGRVDSPAGSGELKKQIQMVAEGSVVYAETAPSGSAANVAPDGFAHPVFRAGFALAIPLPEGR